MRCQLHLEYRGALRLGLDAVLTDVAVGPDGHVQTRAVAARQQILRPVVIDGSGGKVDHLVTDVVDRSRAGTIRKRPYRIGIRDVQRVTDQCHAERRMEMLQKRAAEFRNAVTVRIAQ